MHLHLVQKWNNNLFFQGEECKSAQFRTSRDLTIGDTVGKCALSKYERGIRPQAYRAAWYRDEYLQSQCHRICKYLSQLSNIFFIYFLSLTTIALFFFIYSEGRILFICRISKHVLTTVRFKNTRSQYEWCKIIVGVINSIFLQAIKIYKYLLAYWNQNQKFVVITIS